MVVFKFEYFKVKKLFSQRVSEIQNFIRFLDNRKILTLDLRLQLAHVVRSMISSYTFYIHSHTYLVRRLINDPRTITNPPETKFYSRQTQHRSELRSRRPRNVKAKKEKGGEGGSKRASSRRWIPPKKFQRALTRTKCQSE